MSFFDSCSSFFSNLKPSSSIPRNACLLFGQAGALFNGIFSISNMPNCISYHYTEGYENHISEQVDADNLGWESSAQALPTADGYTSVVFSGIADYVFSQVIYARGYITGRNINTGADHFISPLFKDGIMFTVYSLIYAIGDGTLYDTYRHAGDEDAHDACKLYEDDCQEVSIEDKCSGLGYQYLTFLAATSLIYGAGYVHGWLRKRADRGLDEDPLVPDATSYGTTG